jgi:hypothetical protein
MPDTVARVARPYAGETTVHAGGLVNFLRALRALDGRRDTWAASWGQSIEDGGDAGDLQPG